MDNMVTSSLLVHYHNGNDVEIFILPQNSATSMKSSSVVIRHFHVPLRFYIHCYYFPVCWITSGRAADIVSFINGIEAIMNLKWLQNTIISMCLKESEWISGYGCLSCCKFYIRVRCVVCMNMFVWCWDVCWFPFIVFTSVTCSCNIWWWERVSESHRGDIGTKSQDGIK